MDIAMFHLGDDAHPSHKGFAESVGADLVSCSKPTTSPHSIRSFLDEFYLGSQVSGYDVIIAEGARPLYAAFVNKLVHGSSIIYLGAEHRLYQLIENKLDIHSFYTLVKSLIGNYGIPIIKAVFSRGIDGVITVSEFMKGYLRQIVGKQSPIRIAHPFIQQPLFDDLGELDPTQDSNIVTTVGRPAKYKGVDILVEAWKSVRKSHPKAELHVIGDGHPKDYESVEGVKVLGYVEDLVDAYSRAELYVQPSRVDAFAVTVLEALRGSTPTIVTETTGAKSEAVKLSDNCVTKPDSDSLAKQINWWLDLDNTTKKVLSNEARNLGSKFDPDSRKDTFSQEFSTIIEQI